MLKIKYMLGWVNFSVMMLLRLVLILIGFIIIPIPQLIAFKRKKSKLPKLLWLWDNDEDTFYGAPWYIDKMRRDNGWSDLRISLTWNIIRNPANNLRYAGYGISPEKVDSILDNFTSFQGTVISDIATPVPNLVDDLPDKTYIQTGLVRSGWLYYPIYRKIQDKGDGTYTEIRIGFKYSPWWLQQAKLGKTIPAEWRTRTPSIQYAHREKSYWA